MKKITSIVVMIFLVLQLAPLCHANFDDNAAIIDKLIRQHIAEEVIEIVDSIPYTGYFIYDEQMHIIGRKVIQGDTEIDYTYIYNSDGTFDEIIEKKIINTVFNEDADDEKYIPPEIDVVGNLDYNATIPTKEIEFLKNNHVLVGDPDGNMREDFQITRAEFVTILCRAIGIEDLAQSEEMRNKEIYVDVPKTHWAAGYINAATEQGAINGVGNGYFSPEMSVTNEQTIKTLVAAWGYTTEAEKLGGYPNGYMAIAQQFGVTDSVLFNYGLASRRWVVSVFTYNMLSVMPNEIEIDLVASTEVEKVEKPIGENGSDYIQNPAEILEKITPETIEFERTFFEQRVPENENLPLKIEGKKIIHLNDTEYETAELTICKANDKDGDSTDLKEHSEIDISGYEPDLYRVFVTYRKNNVIDSYYIDLNITFDEIVLGRAYRITYLKYKPIFEKKNTEIEINSDSDYMLPFAMITDSEKDNKVTLCINYPDVLKRDAYFGYDIVSEQNETIEHRVDGKFKTIEPLAVNNLLIGHQYHCTIGVYEKNGGRNAIKGNLEFFNEAGEVKFRFSGNYSTVIFKGYQIGE